jgi:hypothetical protein
VVLSVAVGLLSTAAPCFADLTFVPSLTVSERYDSNVLFTSDRNNEDFITSVSPSISATYRGRPLEATLTGTGSFSAYAKHSDLNYASATGALSVNLTPLVARLDKRARLQLSQSVFYTPELPTFLASNSAGSSPFATGIQPQRAQTFQYTSSVSAGYALTSRVDFSAGYSYSFLNFGSTEGGPPQTTLFRTTSQSVNAGPDIKLTRVDTLSLQYLYQKTDFNGGAVPGFHTQGGTVGLTHIFSPQLTGTIAAGATVISQSDRVAPLARLSVSWSERNTTTTFSFTRAVTPSFTIAATALETNLVALAVSHSLTGRLSAGVGVNYARSSSTSATSATSGSPDSDLLFESYAADLSLNYLILRWLRGSFSYSHYRFNQGFSNSTSTFDRDVVMLALTASWL